MKTYGSSVLVIRHMYVNQNFQSDGFWSVPLRSANMKMKIDLKAFEKLLCKMKIKNDKLHILFYATAKQIITN